MKQKIKDILKIIGNGLQAENAGELMSTWSKSNMLQELEQQVPVASQPEHKTGKDDPVIFHIVPSLIQHKQANAVAYRKSTTHC